MPQNDAEKKTPEYHISELAPSGSDSAKVDDGQDFDPRSNVEAPIGANDDDVRKNRQVDGQGPAAR